MRYWKHGLAILAIAALLAACNSVQDQAAIDATVGPADLTEDPAYTEVWDGRGTDSEDCTIPGADDPRFPLYEAGSGWIHWVFSTKGDSTEALLELGGSGSGSYEPGEPLEAEVWHFYTPFFALDGLTAAIYLDDEPGEGGGLVISDFCPGVGEEELKVTKTADTAFVREHDWTIEKSADPTMVTLVKSGSGDRTVTWTVEVTYEGFEDQDFVVSGAITIENTGDLAAVITGVDDVLAGEAIGVDCGVDFPYTLPVGETLTCTYGEDGYVEGMNEVTVTTERDAFGADAAIVWGDPSTEIHATVDVEDVSDLFGTVDLGSVTAPDGDAFTYSRAFAWADYGADKCDTKRSYENTVSLIGDDDVVLDSDDATLVVKIRCDEPETDVLLVRKSAHTSYERTHHWNLDKRVDKSRVTLVKDGSGDRTVTWTIDVEYLRSTDTSFVIFGEIEIENVSLRTPRTITSVTDAVGVANVMPFDVDCELNGDAVGLPYDLEAGETLVCAYSVDVTDSVDAHASGVNTATVEAAGEDDPLTATANWSFGAPTTETNATVYLWDISDLIGDWEYLGSFDAPDEPSTWTISYENRFEWASYGGDRHAKTSCGAHRYSNWAKLFPVERPASWDDELVRRVARVYVDVVCEMPTDPADEPKDEPKDDPKDDAAA